ncbi:MAG: hypothetical protein KGH53_00610 [Candidatus Micrarchaeota archaeon]|nr:hypothetical protein [Candidatus Micrarchaeota archaeon]
MQKKKWHPKFVVPGFGTRNRSRIPDRWRKQRGTDNKKRVALSGYGATPHVGYKNMEGVRYMRADGKKQVLVHNEKEMQGIVSQKPENTVVIFAHDLSKRKRIMLQAIADKAKIRVANKVKEVKAKESVKK